MTETNGQELKLELKEETDSGDLGNGISITPAIDEDYWLYRVRLNTSGQAIVAFPKFNTIGIGFAQEEDWNTNLPYRRSTEQIFSHIQHNKGDESIPDVVCRAAIVVIQTACHRLKGTDPAEITDGPPWHEEGRI